MFQKLPETDDLPEEYEFDCGNETYVIVYGNKQNVYKLFGKCILTIYSYSSTHHCVYLYINKDRRTITYRTECDVIENAADLEKIVTDFNRLIVEQYEIDGVKFKECEEKFCDVQN